MRAAMRKREPDSASRCSTGMANLPIMAKPAWTMKTQACAVVRSPGVLADGAYREDGQEPEMATGAGVVPQVRAGNK
jgi:hypothetical protein